MRVRQLIMNTLYNRFRPTFYIDVSVIRWSRGPSAQIKRAADDNDNAVGRVMMLFL